MSCRKEKTPILEDIKYEFPNDESLIESLSSNCDWSWFDHAYGKGLTESFNRRFHFNDYHMFLLCKVLTNDLRERGNKGFLLKPTPQIDYLWKMHLRNPVSYLKMCKELVRGRVEDSEDYEQYEELVNKIEMESEKETDGANERIATTDKEEGEVIEELDEDAQFEMETNKANDYTDSITKKRKREDEELSESDDESEARGYFKSAKHLYYSDIIDYDRSYRSCSEKEKEVGLQRLKAVIKSIAPEYKLFEIDRENSFTIRLVSQKNASNGIEPFTLTVTKEFTVRDITEMLEFRERGKHFNLRYGKPLLPSQTLESYGITKDAVIQVQIRFGVC